MAPAIPSSFYVKPKLKKLIAVVVVKIHSNHCYTFIQAIMKQKIKPSEQLLPPSCEFLLLMLLQHPLQPAPHQPESPALQR